MNNGDLVVAVVGALLGGGLLSFGRDWWKDHKTKKARADDGPARIASMSIEGAGEAVEVLRSTLKETNFQLEQQREQMEQQRDQMRQQSELVSALTSQVRELTEKNGEQATLIRRLTAKVADLTAEVARLTPTPPN